LRSCDGGDLHGPGRFMTPTISVIVPVYNEEDGLDALFARLYPALDGLAQSYEIVFINDGSRDRSPAILRDMRKRVWLKS
jgi:undecaprenyl-phosphate 4-deoxy-4-formamido-L-arabinose transferase